MKVLSALLAALLMVFYLGCQENSITDPGTIEDNAIASQNKDMISTYPGLIKVFQSIYDPTHPQNGGDQIKGHIRYSHQLLPLSTSGNSDYSVQVKFFVNLLIDAKCPNSDHGMKVATLADQTLDFPQSDNNSYKVVEKEFKVTNACCGCMNLVTRFKVDKNDVGLLSLKLKKNIGSTQIGIPD